MADRGERISRRELIRAGLRGAAAVGIGTAGAALADRAGAKDRVWQIDPYTCTACGNCETYCVLEQSAVKCVHNFEMCGYCTLCFGYYDTALPDPVHAGGEKQLCPTDAIVRRFVDREAYSYTIVEELCVGCGKCVKGCSESANGSLFLQVRHDRCLNCNDCAIAAACSADAFVRVPADRPYLIKTQDKEVGS